MSGGSQRHWRIAHSESSVGWGGQEHRILAELTGFQRRGCEVALLAEARSHLLKRAAEAGVRTQPLSFGRLGFVLGVVRAAAWLRRQRIEVLNTHSSRDSWLVGVAGRLAQVPFIVRTRHFDVRIPNPRISRIVYGRLSDHIMTTSPKVTAHFQELFRLPNERLSTVPTGVDLSVFSPHGDKADPVQGQATGPLIGMIAVFRLAKGHAILLQAARLLKQAGWLAHYVLVGDGPGRERIADQVRRLGLSDSVTLTGHREDIAAVLRALDALVMPSLHEAVPQVALQALATMTPVVGSRVGGIPSVVRPGETGRLVPPEDAAALAAAIREVFEQPEATRAMCERGRALVEAEHSVETMLDTIEALYQRHLCP